MTAPARSVTFTFDNAVTVTEVGLINGYAKNDPPHDWYAGNRRIERSSGRSTTAPR